MGDALVGSLVAEVEPGDVDGRERRTFRVRPGPPPSVGYASTIAEQHGISLPQLTALFRQRGILSANAPIPSSDDAGTMVKPR
jgi:hypothetical protein